MNIHKRQLDSEYFGINGLKVWAWCYWDGSMTLHARMIGTEEFIPIKRLNVWGEEVNI